jgi:hypothetical protein
VVTEYSYLETTTTNGVRVRESFQKPPKHKAAGAMQLFNTIAIFKVNSVIVSITTPTMGRAIHKLHTKYFSGDRFEKFYAPRCSRRSFHYKWQPLV